MQRPRFKRHWDDRKWQDPINSMTESATSNMLSSAFFLSSLGMSFLRFLPVSYSLSLTPALSVLPLSSFRSRFLSFIQGVSVCQCLFFSPYLSLFLRLSLSFPLLFHFLYLPFSGYLCLFYLSISSPLPLNLFPLIRF